MRKRTLIIVMLLAVCSALTAQPAAPERLALVGGMVLDGYDAPPIHHAAILIDGDRIVRVGPAAEMAIPSGYRIIDTSGRTMMPGMIELHAHLVLLGHGDYTRWFPWIDKQGRAATLPKVMAIAAKQLLMAGITQTFLRKAPAGQRLRVAVHDGHAHAAHIDAAPHRQVGQTPRQPGKGARRRAQALHDPVRATDDFVANPFGVGAAATRVVRTITFGAEFGFDVATQRVKFENTVVQPLEHGRVDIEPVEIAVEDEPLRPGLAVKQRKHRVECGFIAIETADHVQHLTRQWRRSSEYAGRIAVVQRATAARPCASGFAQHRLGVRMCRLQGTAVVQRATAVSDKLARALPTA